MNPEIRLVKKPNTPKAMERIANALNFIEAAQHQLSKAAQELSTLRFGSKRQQRVIKLYDKIHAEWYSLRDFAASPQSLSDDHEELEPES